MGYFRELPNLDYQSFLPSSNSSQNYIRVKNLFRRCKLRDDLQNVFTIFNKYEIRDGARPDNVAEELFGSAELDWVVLMTAGITNVRNEWPLSDKELYDYSLEIYGDALNNIHHYETTEIKDSLDRLILPKGKVVNEDFKIFYSDDGTTYTNDSTKSGSGVTIISDPIIGISNYEYQVIKNDKKRSVYILKEEYLQQFLDDMRQEMIYSKSSQYISEDLIRTENTRVSIP
tara:strand:- start:104 stop:793 length:690 start_codon:yes stop_codon:yes gene_type:complete